MPRHPSTINRPNFGLDRRSVVKRSMIFRCWISTSLFLFCTSGYSATLSVGAEQKYKTIGSAIKAAEANDTVSVERGNYSETLLIDKSLTLKGGTGDLTVL